LAVLNHTLMKMDANAALPAQTDAPAIPAVPWSRVERFVGQLTHDVRNGLNALELQLTFLSEISGNAEVKAEVNALRGTLLQVTRQLQAIKSYTGPVSPHLLCYPSAHFFDDLRERFQRLHPKAAGQVTWTISPGADSLLIDPELALSALLDIFANALQFGGASAKIDLLAQPADDGGGVVITLREAQQQAPAVSTEEWGRAPLLTTRRNAYGLGLFRARQIIEGQGGTLRAEYSAASRILETVITLPAANPLEAV
jgi:signal transduction histidine kinase